MSSRIWLTVALALCLAPVSLSAQAASRTPAVAVSAGAFQFDLSGVGTAPMLALRGFLPISRIGTLELGVLGARPSQQFGETTTFLAPEAQIQLEWPLGRVAPYLGLGGGVAFDIASKDAGGTDVDPTLSSALGLRARLDERLGVRAELRVRGIGDTFQGSSAEWTLGLTYHP